MPPVTRAGGLHLVMWVPTTPIGLFQKNYPQKTKLRLEITCICQNNRTPADILAFLQMDWILVFFGAKIVFFFFGTPCSNLGSSLIVKGLIKGVHVNTVVENPICPL